MTDFKPGDEVRARWPAWGRGPDKMGEPTKVSRVLKTRIECADGTRWQPNGHDTCPMGRAGNYAPRLEPMTDVRRRLLAERLRQIGNGMRSMSDADVSAMLELLTEPAGANGGEHA